MKNVIFKKVKKSSSSKKKKKKKKHQFVWKQSYWVISCRISVSLCSQIYPNKLSANCLFSVDLHITNEVTPWSWLCVSPGAAKLVSPKSQQRLFILPLKSLCSAKHRWRATRVLNEVNDFYQSQSGSTLDCLSTACCLLPFSLLGAIFRHIIPTLDLVGEKWRWPCHGNGTESTSYEIWH